MKEINIETSRVSQYRPGLTLIMPILNEGVRIIPVVSTLFLTAKVPLDLLVVYDKDDDPTLSVLDSLKEIFPNIRTEKNEHKKLIGAIITGFAKADTNVVGIWLSYHVDPYGLFNTMYDMIANQNCDIVSGNRFNKVKRVSRGNAIKKLLSRTANFILNRLIGIPLGDITTSIKLYQKSFIDTHPIKTTVAGGWALSTELTIKAAIEGCKLGDLEFNAMNINLIEGVTNFKVLKHLNQYFKWLLLGITHRRKIRLNYKNKRNIVMG